MELVIDPIFAFAGIIIFVFWVPILSWSPCAWQRKFHSWRQIRLQNCLLFIYCQTIKASESNLSEKFCTEFLQFQDNCILCYSSHEFTSLLFFLHSDFISSFRECYFVILFPILGTPRPNFIVPACSLTTYLSCCPITMLV